MGVGDYRHVGRFQIPTSSPDGDGGTVNVWADLAPPLWPVWIRPATVRDLERQTAGTIVAAATHVIGARYRPDVTVEARMLFQAREFRITGVVVPQERPIVMLLFAVETV